MHADSYIKLHMQTREHAQVALRGVRRGQRWPGGGGRFGDKFSSFALIRWRHFSVCGIQTASAITGGPPDLQLRSNRAN